jgi:hypothetical protein
MRQARLVKATMCRLLVAALRATIPNADAVLVTISMLDYCETNPKATDAYLVIKRPDYICMGSKVAVANGLPLLKEYAARAKARPLFE